MFGGIIQNHIVNPLFSLEFNSNRSHTSTYKEMYGRIIQNHKASWLFSEQSPEVLQKGFDSNRLFT